MSKELTVTTEAVDDIPILVASAERMGVAELVDKHFVVDRKWQGLSLGKMLEGWLSHILSESDHRLNQVEEWAEQRLGTLGGSLGAEVRALDFSDDRLAQGLELLSNDEKWQSFEAALNQRTIRVYKVKAERVRIDTTTGSGYWHVTEDGLFQLGHSKDHRPDLPQLKVVLATLDPMGMPVACQVVAGNLADDPLYIPAIDQVRQGIGESGLLYIGDCKMMSLETRAHLQAGGDDYLGPFSLVQVSEATLDGYLKGVWTGMQSLKGVKRRGADGKLEKVAEGFELSETVTAVVDDEEISWQERRLVVHSLAHAKAAEKALSSRLLKAQSALEALAVRKQGKEPFTDAETLRQAAEKLLEHYDVQGLLKVRISELVQERQVRKYRDHPTETRLVQQLTLSFQRDESAIQKTIRRLGWRVYGTNCPKSQLSLQEAVLAYREEYLVEHCFGRLKGKPLSLTPMYLEDDRHATGLTRLLTIGLRLLTLLEHVARSHLAGLGEKLPGLYAGNPTRATDHPTTEAMLRAFKNIYLNFVTVGGQSYQHLTPLSKLQRNILRLLDLPASIYTRLDVESANPP
jgi:transposase